MIDQIIWWSGLVHLIAYAALCGSVVVSWVLFRTAKWLGFSKDMLAYCLNRAWKNRKHG